MTTSCPKPRRRWRLQYSLRTLLLVVFLFSLVMSWVAVKLEKARRQRKAVEAIEKAGGWVRYDLHVVLDADGAVIDSDYPSVLEERFQIATGAFFSDVTVACCHTARFGDRQSEYLKTFTSLIVLDLCGTQITDQGLMCLAPLTDLLYINLEETQVTPEGVNKLQKALPECEIEY